jgi:myo-inositol-1(or 4)-monophosphatase
MAEINETQLGEIYAFAVQLGKDAGNMLMEAAKSRFGDTGQGGQAFTEKDSAVDIVTKTDEGKLAS